MHDRGAPDVEETLAHPDVHRVWEESYYSGGDAFYERAFDEIVRYLGAPPGATILDAGCGQGYHALRLARRGFRVDAIDFSPAVLEVAKENIEQAGLTDSIRLSSENLTELSFPDQSYEYVLCWGVLMHIPLVEAAIGELSRVLRPGGIAVVSEGNRHSLDRLAAGLLRRLLRRRVTAVVRPAGIETWKETSAGRLLTRRADIVWLIREFERNGVRLEHRRAGEFTEAYTKIRAPIGRSAFNVLNAFWFKGVKHDRLAAGTILFFRKHA